MTTLKQCPACGCETTLNIKSVCGSAGSLWRLECICGFSGQCNALAVTADIYWNALPRRTPGTIEVPVAEIEALRSAWQPMIEQRSWVRSSWYRELEATDCAARAIIARLPPRVDPMLAKLEDALAWLQSRATAGQPQLTTIALIEREIAALKAKDGRP